MGLLAVGSCIALVGRFLPSQQVAALHNACHSRADCRKLHVPKPAAGVAAVLVQFVGAAPFTVI